MDLAWDFSGELAAVELDATSGDTRVRTRSGAEAVVKRTQAVRCPRPLPVGEPARIVRASRVVTGELVVLTVSLSSGDTVQIAGSGITLRAA